MDVPIAIVGMSCAFPGAVDENAFWDLIRDGGDAVSEVPPERYDAHRYYHPDARRPGVISTKWGGFMAGADLFDAQFFGIAPKELKSISPQQRLVVEHSWRALEDACIDPTSLAGTNAGVFCGVASFDYWEELQRDLRNIDSYAATGSAYSVTANRVSYLFDFRGPSIAVDTACSSSLVAVHLARQSLAAGECRVALASGVQFMLSPLVAMSLSQGEFMSPDGRCKPFDARANGYVRGEGVGVLVLKRLDDALRDGDRIRALLAGSAVNQDGRSNGLTAPNPAAQQAVIRAAFESAGLEPRAAGYFEAHGTGTSLGDPIEIKALAAALGPGEREPCVVGSVKSNIGHAEGAAGIAGLIKAMLAIEHKILPPTVHFESPNPLIDLEAARVRVLARAEAWPDDVAPRVAGVSSFGFGGTNAHVVVREWAEAPREVDGAGLSCLPISAKTPEALRDLVAAYMRRLDACEVGLPDICLSAGAGRAHFGRRVAPVGATAEEICGKLRAWLRTGEAPAAERRRAGRSRIGFLFSGQGSQHPRMGRQLFAANRRYRAALERCDAKLRELGADGVVDLLEDPGPRIHETRLTQPALFALQYALGEVWRDWGVEPSFVCGHSIGEYAAACAAGVFSVEDALTLVAARGRLMEERSGRGAMLAVSATEQRVRDVLGDLRGALVIAAVNGEANVVASGREEDVAELERVLAERGLHAQRLRTVQAFHSPMMQAVLEPFGQVAAKVQYHAPRIPFLSSMRGGADVATADYWIKQIVEPVDFAGALASREVQQADALVEIGPRPVLLPYCAAAAPAVARIPTLRGERDAVGSMLEAASKLYGAGATLAWERVLADGGARKTTVPHHPLNKTRHWFTWDGEAASIGRDTPVQGGALSLKRLPAPLHAPTDRVWEANFSFADAPWLAGHRLEAQVVFPGAGFIALVSEALASAGEASTLRGVRFHRPLVLHDDGCCQLQLHVSGGGADSSKFEVRSRAGASGDAITLHATGEAQPIEQPLVA